MRLNTHLIEWSTTMASKIKLSRHQCREQIFKLLFAKDFDKETSAADFYDIQTAETEEPTNENIRTTFLAVCEKADELDAEIESVSVKWKVARMSTATRAILRLAVYEMLMADVPAKVVINEALEIIKLYDDDSAPAFVNGILNKIARSHNLIETAE